MADENTENYQEIDPTLDAEIAASNAAAETADEVVDETVVDETPEGEDVAADDAREENPDDAPEGEGESDDADKEGEEKPEDEGDEDAEDESDEDESDEEGEGDAAESDIKFTGEETAEELAEKQKAVLEMFEGVDPLMQGLIDAQNQVIQKQAKSLQFVDATGADFLENAAAALNALHEVNDEDGSLKPNTAPLRNLIKTHYAQESPDIVRELIQMDSLKYQGRSVLEEVLADTFKTSDEKIARAVQYLQTEEAELPEFKPLIPFGFNDQVKDAWLNLGEIKRDKLTVLSNNYSEVLDQMESETDLYERQKLNESAQALKAELDEENRILVRDQNNILQNKQLETIAERQAAAEAAKAENAITEQYNQNVFKLVDGFVEELSSGGMDQSNARNAVARVQNALRFKYEVLPNGQLNIVNDPSAEYYAKQLKDEGVKFDFQKGRDLLFGQIKAIRNLERLKREDKSPRAIELATKAVNQINNQIAAEQRDLVGQVSSRSVNAGAKKVEEETKKIIAKKQAARRRVSGSTPGKQPLKPENDNFKDIDREVAKLNREVEKAKAYR